jgi:hypothetical protein
VSSHTGQTGQTHRSDWPDAVAPPSSVLQFWLCGSTKEPSSFLVNHWKPRELGVAPANRYSWLGSHVVPARPWFWGSTKKPFMTSSCRSCHHAAHTWLHLPPGPSNEAYFPCPHLEASTAMTFRTCSSPAPALVKPQPAPSILSQELVHTMLSITHHNRKRPSTGPRTTNGPQSPPWWVNWQHTHIVTQEKEKGKEMKKETSTSDRKPKDEKEQDHLKETSLGPLRQGQQLDTSETKLCSSKRREPPNQSLKTTKSSPCTHANPPKPMQLPLDEFMQTTWWKQSSCISSALTSQTGNPHRSD